MRNELDVGVTGINSLKGRQLEKMGEELPKSESGVTGEPGKDGGQIGKRISKTVFIYHYLL